MTATVFIYCDRHPKRVAVTNYDALGDGRWNERYPSRAAQGRRESGQTIIDGDTVTGVPLLDDVIGRDVRSRYAPTCRKCNGPVFQAREESLFAVLNMLSSNGIREVSGGLVSDILSRGNVVAS